MQQIIDKMKKYSGRIILHYHNTSQNMCRRAVGLIEDLEISDIEDHFRKYVNPNNMFVLPKEIGYLGEIDVFIEEQKR